MISLVSPAMVRISQGDGSIQAVFADPRLSWRWLAMSTNGMGGKTNRESRESTRIQKILVLPDSGQFA
jgi:hypothetical protein